MLFSSLTFLVFFLPTVLLTTHFAIKYGSPQRAKFILLLASLFFYSWTFPAYLLILVASIAVNYIIGQSLFKAPDKKLLIIGISFNLFLLSWFKYGSFIAINISQATNANIEFVEIVLPLAISFFTFQQIAYLVDVSKNKVEKHNFVDYAFFVAFFPQLIAGPIVHHSQIMPQLKEKAFARFNASDLLSGLMLFTIGLAKKVLIADQIRVFSDRMFEASSLGVDISSAEAWLGMLCYSFQIYFDFSGYSDMALGLGRIFGLKLPKNFNSPYKSENIVEFWRRWNITLSHFLRDYLYIPLGGNKNGVFYRYINLWIVMVLGGFWHGANWTFMVWGAIHGFYLSVNHAWISYGKIKIPHGISIAITSIAVIVAWVFFRADTMSHATDILYALMGLHQAPLLSLDLLDNLKGTPYLAMLAATIAWFTPNSNQIIDRLEKGQLSEIQTRAWVITTACLGTLSICFIYVEGAYEFLYFQF